MEEGGRRRNGELKRRRKREGGEEKEGEEGERGEGGEVLLQFAWLDSQSTEIINEIILTWQRLCEVCCAVTRVGVLVANPDSVDISCLLQFSLLPFILIFTLSCFFSCSLFSISKISIFVFFCFSFLFCDFCCFCFFSLKKKILFLLFTCILKDILVRADTYRDV